MKIARPFHMGGEGNVKKHLVNDCTNGPYLT